jgi:hypothetical protein
MTEIKIELSAGEITQRLYSIQNVASLMANCDENNTDLCHLQGAAMSIGRLIQDLIDDIGD